MTAGHAQGLAVAALASLAAVFVAGIVLALVAGGLTGGELVVAGLLPMALAGAAGGAAGARAALAARVRGRDAFLVAIAGALVMCLTVTATFGAAGAGEALLIPLRGRGGRRARRPHRRQPVGRASVP